MGMTSEVLQDSRRVLLVEPAFPIPNKSRLHKNFIPIGLLKLGSYCRTAGAEVRLVRGEVPHSHVGIEPDAILVTSLFTYWSHHVIRSARYYRSMFPRAQMVIGGIYASLMPEHCKQETGCDHVFVGTHDLADQLAPAYDMLEPSPDFQVLHASRGCIRRCSFCGVWRIETEFLPKRSIQAEVTKTGLVFYDNNLLANPHIEGILQELVELKSRGEVRWCESQSGFDGRVLETHPRLATLLKSAGFRYPRIAWDNASSDYSAIERQIQILQSAGFDPRDLFVFMIYNYEVPFEELEEKRLKCWEWRVQIADCRYRPLDQTYDNYNANVRGQDASAYFIHPAWTDELVRRFRRNVRRQNICVRYQLPFYSRALENKWVRRDLAARLRSVQDPARVEETLRAEKVDYWLPDWPSP